MTHGLDLIESDQPGDAEEAPREKKKRRGAGFFLLLGSAGVLLLILAVAGFYIGRAMAGLNGIQRDPSLNPSDYVGRPVAATPKADTENAPINFVLMGSDSRGEDTGRSDSLMIAHVTGDRKHVYLISFPRDLWVPIPGKGDGKINWAYAFGGPALTVRTLEQLTGARMDHTVLIDFEGFMKLTTDLDGVTVYNPWTSEQNPGTRFEQGEITIEGERALTYVRERYTLPRGDLDRAYRQRTVVKAIIRKIMTPETLANPATFNAVVGTIAGSVSVDEGMTNAYVTDVARSMKLASGTDGVRLLQAPNAGVGQVGSQSVILRDDAKMAEFAKALINDAMDEYFAAHPE